MKQSLCIFTLLFICVAIGGYGLWRKLQPKIYDQELVITTPVPDIAINDAGVVADEPLPKKRADAGKPILPSLPPIGNSDILHPAKSSHYGHEPVAKPSHSTGYRTMEKTFPQ